MPSKGKGKKKKSNKSLADMDFSAAESLIEGDWGSLEGVQKFIDENSTLGKLNKIIAKRMGGRFYRDPRINNILRQTTRTISKGRRKLLQTKLQEFLYVDGKFVKPGILYHIHYTKDLEEHYMTGWKHSLESKLIFPIKLSDYSTYNSLNKQSPMHIKPVFREITEKDYSRGVITRYFARKSNQIMSPPFEISSKELNTSPLYVYTSFPWRIAGNKEIVSKLNTKAIRKAVRDIPNIDKLLNPFQFYRGNTTLDKLNKEEILNRLDVKQSQSVETVSLNVLGSEATIGQGLLDTMGGKKKVKKKNTKKKKKY